MTLHRSLLCALALFVGLPLAGVGTAEGAIIRSVKVRRTSTVYGMAIVDDGTATAVSASIKSDAGDEDLVLTESDAWLHGAATIKALPKTDATLTLTLYDKGSASLISFSGTLTTEGTVSLTADATKDTGTCDATSRTGCTSDTSATTLDVEVLAAEVFAASTGYEIAVDLAGVDTYEVAYGTFVVTESTEVTTCSKVADCPNTGSSTTTKAEVGWDAIGAVWEGELTVEPEGVIDVKVKTYDANGEELDSTKAALGVPWIDGGEGINVLATDEDPLTTVGFLGGVQTGVKLTSPAVHFLVVNSEGWTSTTVPVAAKVELTNGGTITIPVNSYQRNNGPRENFVDLNRISIDARSTITITGGNFEILDATTIDLATPTCSNGTCVTLMENADGTYALSVSVYGTDATKLPDDMDLTVTITDKTGVKVYSETSMVEFDDDITVVFANEISFSEDPIGLDLSGKLSLLGAADKNGKQKTLAQGKFYGSFSRDGDGDLVIAGADKDTVSARGDLLIGGSPLTIVADPPPLTPVFGNGSGTRNAASETSTKPELL